MAFASGRGVGACSAHGVEHRRCAVVERGGGAGARSGGGPGSCGAACASSRRWSSSGPPPWRTRELMRSPRLTRPRRSTSGLSRAPSAPDRRTPSWPASRERRTRPDGVVGCVPIMNPTAAVKAIRARRRRWSVPSHGSKPAAGRPPSRTVGVARRAPPRSATVRGPTRASTRRRARWTRTQPQTHRTWADRVSRSARNLPGARSLVGHGIARGRSMMAARRPLAPSSLRRSNPSASGSASPRSRRFVRARCVRGRSAARSSPMSSRAAIVAKRAPPRRAPSSTVRGSVARRFGACSFERARRASASFRFASLRFEWAGGDSVDRQPHPVAAGERRPGPGSHFLRWLYPMSCGGSASLPGVARSAGRSRARHC